MKKNDLTKGTWLAVLIWMNLACWNLQAATLISDFSSGSFTIDPISDDGNLGSAVLSQNSSGITTNGGVIISDSFYGSFGSSFDLSGYTSFNLLMTLNSGANPNLPFTVALANSDLTAAYFEGYTTGITSSSLASPSVISLQYVSTSGSETSIPLSQLTSVSLFSFKWTNTGTIDTTLVSVQGVPEPSTGALMVIGAVGLVALRRLRKV